MRYAEILAISSVLAGSALAAPAPAPWCIPPFCGGYSDNTPSTTSSSKVATSSSAAASGWSSGWGSSSSSSMKTTSSTAAPSTTSSSSTKVSTTSVSSSSSSSAAASTSSSSSVVSTSSSSSSVVSTSSAAPMTSSVVASTSTSTSSAPYVSPTIVPSDDGYNYQFCAIEPFQNGVPNGRAFTGDWFRNSNMTVDLCANYCSNLGYTYFGVEYSSECYCGNSFNQGTTLDTANTCNMACAGDATELCGGAGAMNVYEVAGAATTALPTTYSYSSTATATATGVAGGAGSGSGSATATATASATVVPTAEGFNSVVCAVEPFQNGVTESRALTGDHISTANMTVEFCADYCSDYAYFGVEYSSECYCGNTISTGTTQDVAANCNMACAADATELCGGSGRFNLYENSANGGSMVVLPTTYTVAATSTSVSAIVASSTSSVVVATTTSSSVVSTSSSAAATSSVVKTSSASSTVVSTSSAVKTSSSSSAAATSSAVKTSSSVVPTTLATLTKTSSAVASATPGVCAPRGSTDMTTCPSITVNNIFGATKFTNYYKGSGYTLNKSNPANLLSFLFPPKVFTFDASHSICSAASQCMNQAGLMTTLYHSFDLHWDTNACQWSCQLFQGQNTIPSYFNVPAPSVSHGCGFSGSLI